MDITKWRGGILLLLLVSRAASADPFGDFGKMLGSLVGGPKFDLNIEHPPAKQIKVTTVAIAKPEGECAEDLAARVEEDFVGAGVTVIDRQRLENILAEHKLQVSALTDQKTAAKIGALLGAQALLFLKVIDCHGNKNQQLLGNDGKGHSTYNYIVQETLSGSVRVINLTSGQVLASQRFEGTGQAQNYEGYPDPAIAMGEAAKTAAFSVHKLLLPWKETKHIVFYSDSQCDLKVASNFLKSKDIDGALAQSEKNLASCPSVTKVKPATMAHAYYNLGVLQFMKDDFDAALAHLNKALELDNSKVYTDAIADCKQAKKLATEMVEYQKDAALAQGSNDNAKASQKPIKVAGVLTVDSKKPTSASTSASGAVADRLANLEDLLKKKLITQDEYNTKRAQILGGI